MNVGIQTHHAENDLQRGRVHWPAARIARLFVERGYGFIETPDGEEVYFDRYAVDDLTFESLTLGAVVELEIEPLRPGLQAARVFLADDGSVPRVCREVA